MLDPGCYLILFVTICCYVLLFVAIAYYFLLCVTICCYLGSLFVAICYYLSSYLLLVVAIWHYFVLLRFPKVEISFHFVYVLEHIMFESVGGSCTLQTYHDHCDLK